MFDFLKKSKKNPIKNEINIDKKLEKQVNKQEIKEKKRQEQQILAENKKKVSKLIRDWIEVMAHTGTDNKLDETFKLEDIKIEPYGFKCNIRIAKGLTFSVLESETMVRIIEDNIGCLFITKRKPKAKYIQAQFITEEMPDVDFKPLKLPPYEVYMGISIDGEPIIISMLKYPHILIQGATNMGKTKAIDCILTNLITQCSPEELSLYLIQTDKSDQAPYRRCKHTKAFARTVEEVLAITNYLKEVICKRDETLRPYIEDGECGNIYEYNLTRKSFDNSKFTYIYVVVDEYPSLMPADGELKDIKDKKNAIQSNMDKIVQIGRYVGVYVIIGNQRATIDKMPSFIKAMCNTITSFKVNNEKSSYVALDSNDAVNLQPREFIVKTTERVMAKTVTLTQKMIVDYISPFRVTENQYRPFNFKCFINEEVKDNKNKAKDKKTKKEKREESKKSTDQKQKAESKTELSDKDIEKLYVKNEKEVIPITKKELKVIEDNNINKKQEFELPQQKRSQYYMDNWDEVSKNNKVVKDNTGIDYIVKTSKAQIIKEFNKEEKSNYGSDK